MYSACKIMGVIVVMFIIAGSQDVKGEIILTISDNGSDLIMTATGTYDMSSLEAVPGTLFMGDNALVGPNKGTYGWDTESEQGSKEYIIEFIGSLSGTGFAKPAASTTGTTPFFVYMPQMKLSFPAGAPEVGNVNQTAIFTGVTMASIGMVPGEEVVGFWEGDSILIQTIPEPASVGLIGLFTGCLYFSRRFVVA